MGSDDVYTDLVLGISHHPKDEKSLQSVHQENKIPYLKSDNIDLTLAISNETTSSATIPDVNQKLPGEPNDTLRQTSSPTAVSSFSNSSSFKRDRDMCHGDEIEAETEVELERISSKLSEEEEDGTGPGSPKKKLRLTKEQSAILEYSFKDHTTLNSKQKQDLARKLNLSPRQVEVWFQNRRARTKLKQTEESFDLLKKCCESLTEENRRLKKAVQDIKSLKSAPHPPFYMQLRTATLSMCPSCERICSVGAGYSPTSTLSDGPKPNTA